MTVRGILRILDEDASHFGVRYVPDFDQLQEIAHELRASGRRIVLTSGSFDILHEGHSMYLEAARAFGDFLIVGVDSDEKVRARKGSGRPAVPEAERLRMVTHQRGVGVVTLKHVHHPRWELIRRVRPHVLVATQGAYSAADVQRLRDGYGVEAQVLPRMATVSTSARLRRLQLGLVDRLDAELLTRA